MAILSDAFLAEYAGKQPNWGFNGLGYVVYKRTYARVVEGEDRTEEWWETVQRVVEGAQEIGAEYTPEEAERLYEYIFKLKAIFGGRMLWQLGTDFPRKFAMNSLLNCWFTNIRTVEDFCFVFENLMLGGGVGFSVRRSDVHELPRVKRGVVITQEATNDADFIVPDSRQGWSKLLYEVLNAYFHTGKGFSYSTILVRGAGEPIATFGGTASGPVILIEGIENICKVLDARAGKKIRSVDALDIVNIIGQIVVSGNVRRSAQIAIGDPDDMSYLRAKRWDLGNIPGWRGLSNNTVDADSYDQIMPQLWDGYRGDGEPYGLFNQEVAAKYGRYGEVRKDDTVVGLNPCAEITLADKECCNLSEAFLPNIDSEEEFKDIITLLYKTNKAITAGNYLHEETNKIVHKNMRIGISISGIMQAKDKWDWLDPGYRALRDFDKEWSAAHGWPESIRLTTVKPSGTVSLLAGVTPGVHPAFSRYHIRRVRMATSDPMVQYCKDRGFVTEFVRDFDGKEDHNTTIVEFPCEFPTTTTIASDVSAIEQLEVVRLIQQEWADNAVSCTVYYRKEELGEIQEWLDKYYKECKSLSFLLHSGHGFLQAPLEEVDELHYRRLSKKVKEITPVSTNTYVADLSADCAGGACPIR